MYRKQLLIHEESSNPDLKMLLKVIDLLASCAEGENLFIESICQNVIGISELLQVLLTYVKQTSILHVTCLFIDFIHGRS